MTVVRLGSVLSAMVNELSADHRKDSSTIRFIDLDNVRWNTVLFELSKA